MSTPDEVKPSRATPGPAERLAQAALELFAQRGVEATTVGDIESAAGFAPRSGALYKYFASKNDLLAAGVERHLATVKDFGDELALRPLGDIRSELTLIGYWLLAELENERTMTHLLEREGDRHPELRDRLREGISDQGYQIGSALTARWRPDLAERECDAMSVIVVGALINYRRSGWTFGRPPLDLDEDTLISTWADLCMARFESGS